MFSFTNSIEFLTSANSDTWNYGELKRAGDAYISGRLWQGLNGALSDEFPLYAFASPKYLCDGGIDRGLNLLSSNNNWVNYPRYPEFLSASNIGTQTLKLDVISYSGVLGNVVNLTYNYQSNQSNQLSSINITDGQTNQTISFMQSFVGNGSYMLDYRECNKTYYLDTLKTSNNDKYGFNYYSKVVFNNHSTGSDAWVGVNQLTVDGLARNFSTIKFLPYAPFSSTNYGISTSTEIGTFPNSVHVQESRITEGVLESIIYPTGGLTKFEFGPNEYFDSYKNIAGGLRINRIKYYNSGSWENPVSEKIYKYGENESGDGFIKKLFRWSSNSILKGYYYIQKRKYLKFFGVSPSQYYSVQQEDLKTTILPGSVIDMFYSNGSPIYYTEVAEYKEANGALSGKTVYNYINPENNYYNNIFMDNTNMSLRKDNWDNGQLKSETYFIKSSNGFDTIKSKIYDYAKYIKTQIPVIDVFQNTEYWGTDNQNLLPSPGYDASCQSYISNSDFWIVDYGLPVGDMLLTKEVEKTKDGLNEIIKTTNYFHKDSLKSDIAYLTQITNTETTLSNGKKQQTYFTYPQNYAAGTPFIDSLKMHHMQTSLIEKITTVEDKVIEGILSTYLSDNPAHIAKTFELDPKLPLALSNFNSIKNTRTANFIQDPNYYENLSLEYANKRLAMVTPKDNVHTCYYWGYQNTYPVIKAENISYSDLNTAVNAALIVTLNGIGNNSIDDLTNTIGTMWLSTQKARYQIFITSLRNNPLLANAQLTYYTYSPLTGMTSQTDPKGMTTYFEYDNFKRLKSIKDQSGNIIKSFDYHYKP